MKKIILSLLICFLALVAGQSQGIPATPDTPDEKSLSFVLTAYSSAVNACDAEAWISLWDADGIRLPPDEPMQVGRAEIWRLNKDSFGVIDAKFSVVQNEVVVFGDFGYVRGTYAYSFKTKLDGPTLHFAGKYLTLCRRQPDGTWRIYRDTFNDDPL